MKRLYYFLLTLVALLAVGSSSNESTMGINDNVLTGNSTRTKLEDLIDAHTASTLNLEALTLK